MNELEQKVEKLQRGMRWSIGFGLLGVLLKLFLPFGLPGFATLPPNASTPTIYRQTTAHNQPHKNPQAP